MGFFDDLKSRYQNTMEEVRLNVHHGKVAVQRRSALSEIGMLYMKKGKRGVGDQEIDDLIKKVTVISREINSVGKELQIQDDVDFSQVKSGKDPLRDFFNELMLRISTSSEKYSLRNKYDGLVEKGFDVLSQLGYFALTSKDAEFEKLREFQEAKNLYERIDSEYSHMGKELKEIQVLGREKSEFLIPVLTFLFSFQDYTKKTHYKK